MTTSKLTNRLKKGTRAPAYRSESLADSYPDLALEWHQRNYWSPNDFGAASSEKVWWRCPRKHVFRRSIIARTSAIARGSLSRGCLSCAGSRPHMPRIFAPLPARLIREWKKELNGISARHLYKGQRHFGLWQCSRHPGHIWRASVGARTTHAEGCPSCYPGKRIDLRRTPEVSSVFDRTKNVGFDMRRLPKHMHVFWRCPVGHRLYRSYAKFERNAFSCPRCSRRTRVGAQLLKIISSRPDLLAELDAKKNKRLDKAPIGLASKIVLDWVCAKGPDHRWSARLYERAIEGTGCPFCANKRVSVTNTLANHPELLEEWHPVLNMPARPESIVASSKTKCWWICQHCSYEWRTEVRYRTMRGSGCRRCKARQVLEG